MNIDNLKQILEQSRANKLSFPERVKKLVDAGVESYHIDLIRLDESFYFTNGESYVGELHSAAHVIHNDFDATQVIAAIRESQAQMIDYAEFLNRITRAGTSYYIAYLLGRKVMYLGKNGDFHCELFPDQ